MTELETPMVSKESIMTLREVTKDNLRAVMRLKVAPEQEHFVASNAVSIAQAHFEPEMAWFRAIYADEVPVGFMMLWDDASQPRYFLWRLMLDARYQKYGFGKRAMELLFEYVKTRPGATEVFVSCVPGEGSPYAFYEKLGFSSTGEMEDDEVVMRRAL